MANTFYFMDGLQPDKTSKKRMRRHVMRGKNAGRKLSRASRQDLFMSLRQPKAMEIPGLYNKLHANQRDVTPSTVDEAFGDTILTSSLPMVEMKPYSKHIVNQFFNLTTERLYPTTIGFSLHEIKLLWLQLLFTDEAAYHCNMSLMQACNEIYLGNGKSSTSALYHLSQTFTQIQRRLESRDALSNSTLGLVTSLITKEQIRNQGPAADVHAKGLQRMIELRGGLDQLEDNLTLLLQICKTDIMLSLQYGRPIMFFRDHMAEVWKKLALKGYSLDNVPVIPCENLGPYLHAILSEIMSICDLLNRDPRQPILDFLGFEETFVSICYRLLRLLPVKDSKSRNNSQNACHLGLLMFVMTTFFQLGRKRIIDFKALSLRFQDFLSSDLCEVDNMCEVDNNLSLWAVTIGGIWNLGTQESAWIASKLRNLTQRRKIGSWCELRSCLMNLPWIRTLHDEPGHTLWDQVQRGR